MLGTHWLKEHDILDNKPTRSHALEIILKRAICTPLDLVITSVAAVGLVFSHLIGKKEWVKEENFCRVALMEASWIISDFGTAAAVLVRGEIPKNCACDDFHKPGFFTRKVERLVDDLNWLGNQKRGLLLEIVGRIRFGLLALAVSVAVLADMVIGALGIVLSMFTLCEKKDSVYATRNLNFIYNSCTFLTAVVRMINPQLMLT